VDGRYSVNERCVPGITQTADWFLMKREKPFVDCTNMDAGCDGLFIRHYDVVSRQYVLPSAPC
jgi:hypothetical protein